MGEQQDVTLSIQAFKDLLHRLPTNMPGRSLFDEILHCMWDMGSIDSLFGLFDKLGDYLVSFKEEASEERRHKHIRLSKTSPLGAFIRRARLEFVRLPFDDIVKLWCAFVGYRAPTAFSLKKLAGSTSLSLDHVAAEMGVGQGEALFHITYGRLVEGGTASHPLSVDDLERVLEFQLDKLQRQCKLSIYCVALLKYYRAWLSRTQRDEETAA